MSYVIGVLIVPGNTVFGFSPAYKGTHGSMISMVNEMPVSVNSDYPALTA